MGPEQSWNTCKNSVEMESTVEWQVPLHTVSSFKCGNCFIASMQSAGMKRCAMCAGRVVAAPLHSSLCPRAVT